VSIRARGKGGEASRSLSYQRQVGLLSTARRTTLPQLATLTRRESWAEVPCTCPESYPAHDKGARMAYSVLGRVAEEVKEEANCPSPE
jgi:hypothetical protein